MEQDPDPYRTPDLTGASQEPGEASRWRIPRAGIAAGMTAFLCLAGAGAAFAVGGSGGTSGRATLSSGSGSTPPTKAPGGGRMHGPRGGMPGLVAVLNGVYTASNGSTGFKTM
ncbi:MAG: hypothetical protein ACRDRL_16540, partial [Sciscionella sp.]